MVLSGVVDVDWLGWVRVVCIGRSGRPSCRNYLFTKSLLYKYYGIEYNYVYHYEGSAMTMPRIHQYLFKDFVLPQA